MTISTPLYLYVVMYFMAIADRFLERDKNYYERAQAGIPWLLLPEAISDYSVLARAARFERAVPEYSKDYPWMVFPNQEDLCKIKAQGIKEAIEYHIPEEVYYSYAVPERTCIDHFDCHNFVHHSYHDLRCFFIYNHVFDDMIRKMINIRMRASNMYYINGSNVGEECLNSEELVGYVEQFNWLAAIYLAGLFYKKTGVLMDKEWFESIMKNAFEKSNYPEAMKECILKKVQMPDWVAERIEEVDFDITREDCNTVIITEDLMGTFRQMFSRIYREMCAEF